MHKEKLALAAEKREETGKKLSALRRAGFVPGVVYGHNMGNVNIKVQGAQFSRVFSQGGENTLVELSVAGEEKPYSVLIYDVSLDPVKSTPIHVDFFAVNLKEKVKAEVPLVIVGEAPAVKELEGTLIQPLHAIEVECLPSDIPHEISVDVSGLKTFEDHLSVSDITVPEGVEILTDKEEIIASVQEPRSQEELEALETEVEEDVTKVEGVADAEVVEGEEGGVEAADNTSQEE